ncbi:hypothetical protein IWC96_12495 [Brevundimonas sp. BAL450]|jgi:hypothetical protein|uniref:Uncharacterized protein n=1 Tax=Brevundimonas abyssalis TAR-001 TaxID=1391729 RepID=A0A8E0NC03_9CAUL|nr:MULTISPECIES: hypothetical protein [Brevundimonas]MBG7616090.1 hypothetical protein [Brevundimonas sp. BAL450]GAD59579.1 hypothetical protein MBEBAB_1829 [Brevundimonas abyssalis TAR-001]
MRAVLAAVILAIAVPHTAEASIRIRLQATVAASCGVADISVEEGRITVLTICNAEHFQLNIQTVDGPVTILAANSPDASVNLIGGALGVTSRAPGAQRFVVDTDTSGLTADNVVAEAVAA